MNAKNHEARDEAMSLFEQEAADQEESGIDENKLGLLARMALHQMQIEDQIANTEAELKRLKAQLREVAEDKIPTLMVDEIQLQEITLANGAKIKVSESIKVSTTGKWRDPINAWLAEIGEEALIKDELKISLGTGESEKAQAIIQAAAEAGAPVDRKQYVAPQSLSALMRELLEQGEDVPLEKIGAFTVRASKISRPKA